MDSKVEGNIQRREGIMNIQVWRMGGGQMREGERVRDKERKVLTPVIALMYNLI